MLNYLFKRILLLVIVLLISISASSQVDDEKLRIVGYSVKAPVIKFGKITAKVLIFGGLPFIAGLTVSIASNLP